MAPRISDFIGPGRDDRVINAAIREIRAWPLEQARALVWQLVDHDPVMALRVARRVLRGRRPFEELLRHGFATADVSTIRWWLAGVLGPLSADRIVELYEELARADAEQARVFAYSVFPFVRAASRTALDHLTELNRELSLDGSLEGRPLALLIVELSGLQERLLDELHRRHPGMSEQAPPMWPSRVALEIDGEAWVGFRHGSGYRFASADGRVVQAHDRIALAPYPIDAYRVMEYAESLGVSSVWGDDGRPVELETRALEASMGRLVSRGLLVHGTRLARPVGLARYVVVAPKFRCLPCGRGWVIPVRVRATGASIWVCDACERLWTGHSAPRRDPDSTLALYMEASGLPARWSELVRRDRESPTLSSEATAARCREIVDGFVLPDGVLASSSHALEQAVDEIIRAVGGAPEPLVRAAWSALENRALDRATFSFCKDLALTIHVRRTVHWEWDLTWTLASTAPAQVCMRSWILTQRRDLWTGELAREAADVFAAHGVG